MGSWGREATWQGSSGRITWARWGLAKWVVPHLNVYKPGRTLVSETDCATQDSSTRKQSLKTLAIKTYEGCCDGRNSKAHSRVSWRDSQSPRMYTNPLTEESAPQGPNLLVGSGRNDWKPAESTASSIVPSWTPPQHTKPSTSMWVAPPTRIPEAPPLTM